MLLSQCVHLHRLVHGSSYTLHVHFPLTQFFFFAGAVNKLKDRLWSWWKWHPVHLIELPSHLPAMIDHTYKKDGLENKHVLKQPNTDQSITYNTSPFQWVGAVVASVKYVNINNSWVIGDVNMAASDWLIMFLCQYYIVLLVWLI